MELGRPDREKFPQDPPRRIVAAAQGQNHQPPPPQKCPRCDSSNTKFCYYNNYSLSQPRYFCKGCRRYWTHGGTLRNVPVGGGCRKSKRPKQSAPSSSPSGGEIARRTQPSISQNLTAGMASAHHQSLIRALPPVVPSIGNSLYTGGGVLSSLGAIQSLPAGIMSPAPPSVNYGGGSQLGANMALLQGLNLPQQLKPQAPPLQFPQQSEFFPSDQNFNFLARPLNPWTHSFINRDQASTSAANPSFWSGGGGGDNQPGSSFQWIDKTTGFDPSE